MRNVKALIIIIALLCSALIFTLLVLVAINSEMRSSFTLFNDVMIVFVLFFVTIMIFNQYITRKQTKAMRTAQPVTRITCQNCKYSEKRIFQSGDYIFKYQGSCLKCGGKMIIEAIYLPSQVKNEV